MARNPGSLVDIDFFNPVPVMGLVELIRGLQIDDATHGLSEDFARHIGKTPVTARKQRGLRRQPHPVPDDQRGDFRGA